jgi:hypothetical protein
MVGARLRWSDVEAPQRKMRALASTEMCGAKLAGIRGGRVIVMITPHDGCTEE